MKFAPTMHALAIALLAAGFSVNVAAQTTAPRDRADVPQRSVGQTADDAAITAKVKAALVRDDLVKARNIDVDTKWGVVALSGRVASNAERDQAVQLARGVEGVRGVRANLGIGERVATRDATPSGRGENRTVGQTADDAGITAKVKAALTDDDLVKARNIDVDTRRGVVSLRGNVASNAERDQAVRLARKVEGVRNVQANLRIGDRVAARTDSTTTSRTESTASRAVARVDETGKKVGGKIDDAAITAKVKATLIRDDLVKARNIDVDTTGGRVTLTGNVASNAEREQAVRLARRIEGVRGVQANLKIGAAPTASTGASAAKVPEHSKPVSQ